MKSNEFLAEYSNELLLKDEYGRPKRWRLQGRDWVDDQGKKADANLKLALNSYAQNQKTATTPAQTQQDSTGVWGKVTNFIQGIGQAVNMGAFRAPGTSVANQPTWKRPDYTSTSAKQQPAQQPAQQPQQKPVQGNQPQQQPQQVNQPVKTNQPVTSTQPVQQPAGSNNPAQNINITNKNTNTNTSAVAQGVKQATQPQAQTGTAQQNTQTVVAPKTNNVSPVATTNTQQKLTQPTVTQTPNYSNMLGSTHVQGQAPASINYNIPKPSAQQKTKYKLQTNLGNPGMKQYFADRRAQNAQNAPELAAQESTDFSAMLLKKMLK